jgi:hypothetical protein
MASCLLLLLLGVYYYLMGLTVLGPDVATVPTPTILLPPKPDVTRISRDRERYREYRELVSAIVSRISRDREILTIATIAR